MGQLENHSEAMIDENVHLKHLLESLTSSKIQPGPLTHLKNIYSTSENVRRQKNSQICSRYHSLKALTRVLPLSMTFSSHRKIIKTVRRSFCTVVLHMTHWFRGRSIPLEASLTVAFQGIEKYESIYV